MKYSTALLIGSLKEYCKLNHVIIYCKIMHYVKMPSIVAGLQ